MEHAFGPGRGAFTLGIEEELMILDGRTLDLTSAIDVLADPDDGDAIKPELHQAVLEIATEPARNAAEAGTQLRRLRARVRERAEDKGLRLAASGTHPFARWEDQRISPDERYRSLIDQLGFVARQEVIFGQHVHVAVDDPDTAVAVANGMRRHVPLLVAMAANSPFWMGADSGMASARVPVFRQFPRVGIPPRYADWEDWVRRIEFMQRAGMIADHTWFWWDVRIAPAFGTVEVRAMDTQTHVDHAIGFAALVQALVRALVLTGGDGADMPDEILSDNKWRAARYGLEGDLVDLPSVEAIPAARLARRVLDEAREHATDLGSADAMEALEDLLEHGNGAMRQRRVHGANRDFAELVGDLADAT